MLFKCKYCYKGIRTVWDGPIKTKNWHSLKDNDHAKMERFYKEENDDTI